MNLDDLQRLSPLLGGLATDELGLLAAQASNRRFGAGQTMFNEDARADVFYILEQGTVGLELSSPGRPAITIQTLGAGDLVGISWLFPPYRWSWRARAVTDVTAAAFDAAGVRELCETNETLRVWVFRVVAEETARRLHNTRVQLLDLYRSS